MSTTWTVQDAKNRFSEVIEHALHDGPQTITRRGRETAVLVSVAAFRAMSGTQGDLVDFLSRSPLADIDLDLDRKPEYGRGIEL
jgi:prevent-host-death family protein